MKYVIVQQYSDGDLFICKPNTLLSITEAKCFLSTYQRQEPSSKFFIMQVVD